METNTKSTDTISTSAASSATVKIHGVCAYCHEPILSQELDGIPHVWCGCRLGDIDGGAA